MAKNKRIRGLQYLRPVHLGQMPPGLLLAATLILLWQCTQTAQATLTNAGFSENDFFRIDWDYGLANGTGKIIFNKRSDLRSYEYIGFSEISFMTVGLTFDSITNDGEAIFSDPAVVGGENGFPIYQYNYNDEGLIDKWSLFSFFFPNLKGPSEQIDVIFPTRNISLCAGAFEFDGGILSGSGSLNTAFGDMLNPQSSIDFVSVQAIPEPTLAALLGVGTDLTTLAARRKEKAQD